MHVNKENQRKEIISMQFWIKDRRWPRGGLTLLILSTMISPESQCLWTNFHSQLKMINAKNYIEWMNPLKTMVTYVCDVVNKWSQLYIYIYIVNVY